MNELDKLISKEPHWNYLISNGEKIREITENEDYEKLEQIEFENEPYFSFSYFNYEGNRTIFTRIKELIENAKNTKSFVLVSSLYINSLEIYELLIDALNILKGKLYILVGDNKKCSFSYDRNGRLSKTNILDLESAGAMIRLHSGAHLKFLIAGNQSMVFTTNLSSDGLFYNPEFGLVFKDDPWMNSSLKQIFSYLWHEKSEKMLVNHKWINSHNWNMKTSQLSQEIQHVPGSFKPLFVTSKRLIQQLHKKNKAIHSQRLYDYIPNLIRSAKKSIKISIYSIYPLQKYEKLINLLKEKQKKGVKIQILIPEYKTIKTDPMNKLLKNLSKSGIEVRFYREIHGKTIIIDSDKFLMFTGNFNKYLYDDNSFDLGIYTKRKSLVNNMVIFWDLLWKEANISPHNHPFINLDLDLVIKSQNMIRGKKQIDISQLEKLIHESKEVQLITKDEKYAISIYGKNKYPLNLYFEVLQMSELENRIFLSAIINQKSGFTLKLGEIYKINKLNLNLYWPKR